MIINAVKDPSDKIKIQITEEEYTFYMIEK